MNSISSSFILIQYSSGIITLIEYVINNVRSLQNHSKTIFTVVIQGNSVHGSQKSLPSPHGFVVSYLILY